jgi:hypothetical protein
MKTFADISANVSEHTYKLYYNYKIIVLPSTFMSLAHPCASASHWNGIQFCNFKICSSWERSQTMTAILLVKESVTFSADDLISL